jgi:hemerythrin superfamily protein
MRLCKRQQRKKELGMQDGLTGPQWKSHTRPRSLKSFAGIGRAPEHPATLHGYPDAPLPFGGPEMSIVDKFVAAVTPPESEEARVEARAKARRLAKSGNWLSLILEHHVAIEAQFEVLKAARPEERPAAQEVLSALLAGHSIAEEMAIYPAMAGEHQPGHAELAYQEQSAAKMELGLLERLDPAGQDYHDKLEHLRGAVAHHVYSEEGTWFPELIDTSSEEEQQLITSRYREEFGRYKQGI